MIVSKCHLESLMFLNKQTSQECLLGHFVKKVKEGFLALPSPQYAVQTIFRLTDSGNIRIQHQQGNHSGGETITSNSANIPLNLIYRIETGWVCRSLFEMLYIFHRMRGEEELYCKSFSNKLPSITL